MQGSSGGAAGSGVTGEEAEAFPAKAGVFAG